MSHPFDANVPEALKPLFSYMQRVEHLFDEKITRSVDEITEAAGEITSFAVVLYNHGERPENSSDFWYEIGKARGKNKQSSLIDYMLKAQSKGMNERIGFFKVKSQMISTINWFTTSECYPVVHTPTEGDILAEIKAKGGVLGVHRLWTKHITIREREAARERSEREARHAKRDREDEAAAKDMTVPELEAWEAAERERQKREADAAKWMEYVNRGTVVVEPWTDDGSHYIRHNGKLIRFSDLDADRIHACMIRPG